ncbi:MAG: DegT/DnrJ/EryC1/StrS family aminotransferase [Armatimonadota bacterium]
MIRVGKPEIEAVTRLLESGRLFRYSDDPDDPTEVTLFEKEWAQKIGTQYALAVTSGTAALICACAGLGIGPGDEVIIPGYTFMATATAVLACGAIPVLADVDETLCLDPGDIERHLSPRTKAIMPVHMLGLPCDMDAIMAVARKHGLAVIEDACQADAGAYRGRRLGSIGDVGAFSFNYYKVLTCGEGGAITTNSERAYDIALVMHDSGLTFRPIAGTIGMPTFIGNNFRLNNILGAVLRAQLSQIDGWLAAMRAIRRQMENELREAGVPLLPSNDSEGGTGHSLGIQFRTEEETARCMAALKGKLRYMRPFDTGRHVYVNWDPMLEHRASHCPEMNPFQHPANRGAQMNYTPDMLPRTLDILKRTLVFELTPFLTQDRIAEMTQVIRKAARSAAGVAA